MTIERKVCERCGKVLTEFDVHPKYYCDKHLLARAEKNATNKDKLYHFTFIENIESILENGLLPKQKKGLMSKSDGFVYLTDSPKYIRIMAKDIAKVSEYAIATVDTSDVPLSLVWWKGKRYREWTARTVEPSKILNVKVVNIRIAEAQMQPRLETAL